MECANQNAEKSKDEEQSQIEGSRDERLDRNTEAEFEAEIEKEDGKLISDKSDKSVLSDGDSNDVTKGVIRGDENIMSSLKDKGTAGAVEESGIPCDGASSSSASNPVPVSKPSSDPQSLHMTNPSLDETRDSTGQAPSSSEEQQSGEKEEEESEKQEIPDAFAAIDDRWFYIQKNEAWMTEVELIKKEFQVDISEINSGDTSMLKLSGSNKSYVDKAGTRLEALLTKCKELVDIVDIPCQDDQVRTKVNRLLKFINRLPSYVSMTKESIRITGTRDEIRTCKEKLQTYGVESKPEPKITSLNDKGTAAAAVEENVIASSSSTSNPEPVSKPSSDPQSLDGTRDSTGQATNSSEEQQSGEKEEEEQKQEVPEAFAAIDDRWCYIQKNEAWMTEVELIKKEFQVDISEINSGDTSMLRLFGSNKSYVDKAGTRLEALLTKCKELVDIVDIPCQDDQVRTKVNRLLKFINRLPSYVSMPTNVIRITGTKDEIRTCKEKLQTYGVESKPEPKIDVPPSGGGLSREIPVPVEKHLWDFIRKKRKSDIRGFEESFGVVISCKPTSNVATVSLSISATTQQTADNLDLAEEALSQFLHKLGTDVVVQVLKQGPDLANMQKEELKNFSKSFQEDVIVDRIESRAQENPGYRLLIIGPEKEVKRALKRIGADSTRISYKDELRDTPPSDPESASTTGFTGSGYRHGGSSNHQGPIVPVNQKILEKYSVDLDTNATKSTNTQARRSDQAQPGGGQKEPESKKVVSKDDERNGPSGASSMNQPKASTSATTSMGDHGKVPSGSVSKGKDRKDQSETLSPVKQREEKSATVDNDKENKGKSGTIAQDKEKKEKSSTPSTDKDNSGQTQTTSPNKERKRKSVTFANDLESEGQSATVDNQKKVPIETKAKEDSNSKTSMKDADTKEQSCHSSECSNCKGTSSSDQKNGCSHTFCFHCVQNYFHSTSNCVVCTNSKSEQLKTQPVDGQMLVSYDFSNRLPGFENTSTGTIVITYAFKHGFQTDDLPYTGAPYPASTKTAFLPACRKANEILELLHRAFESRLTFQIQCTKNHPSGEITWNGILHKERIFGGPQEGGYPDAAYLDRVRADLLARGIH